MNQIELASQVGGSETYGPAFKRLYYHLYTNSTASRAETIISDLANLLLCKAGAERSGSAIMTEFAEGKATREELIAAVREAYPQLIASTDQFRIDTAALRRAAQELAPISFAGAPGHVLGDAFEALIGPRLRGDKGQFFTPRSLVRAIVKVVNPQPNTKIVDPACGTGGFLAEAQMFVGRDDASQTANLVGIDKDADLSKLAESMLEWVAPGTAIVHNTNSLDIKNLQRLDDDQSPFHADFVLTNPPFGTKIKVTDRDILSQFELGHKWVKVGGQWERTDEVLTGQDPQILFVELCVKLLRDGGRMGIVLPEGVFGNKGEGYVWAYLRALGRVEALIDCPRTTFQPGTDVKTNVLVFEKGRADDKSKVWFAVAIHCGHDRRGRSARSDGSPFPDDFKTIGDAYLTRALPWQEASIATGSYLVPRYYDQLALAETGREVVSIGELERRGELLLKKGHEVGSEAYGTGDIPFVRTSDINNYEISIDPTKGVSEDVYATYKATQNLRAGDLLMINDGRYRIGRTAILTEDTVRCVVQSHIRILSLTENARFDPFELLYLLNLPGVQHQIRNLVFIQSTLGTLGSRVREIKIPLPNRQSDWSARIERFRNLIEGRAKSLRELSQFEHGDLEL